MSLHDIVFAYPQYFYLFAVIPLLTAWYWWRRKKQFAEIQVSTLEGFAQGKSSLRQRLLHLPFIIRMLVLALIIIALARPQSSSHGQNVTTEGIDIIISMDISGSMLAEDFKPNRIEAAKKVAREFVDARESDRIGLVIFSGESFTQCPLTTDHDVLKNLFADIKSGMVVDGTAIGEGLATAVSRLKDSKAKSKVIILLTDGVNNAGSVAPLTAAEIAKTFGIRTYTIGIGTKGMAPYPFPTPYGTQYRNMEVQIDEDILRQIASMTGGKYFRATGNKKLQEVYQEIDTLEKTRIDVTEFKHHAEEFLPFALGAGIFFLLEFIIRNTLLRKIP